MAIGTALVLAAAVTVTPTNSAGLPASVAPLSWTDAVTMLALLAQARHLQAIPVPPPGRSDVLAGMRHP